MPSALALGALSSATKTLIFGYMDPGIVTFILLICTELKVSWQFLTVFILQKQIQSLNKMCSNLLEKISKEERESESGGMSLRWKWDMGSKQQI